ncbi:MAG: hypothetical protein AB1806_19085 [Acidobacteriota bacterium]
MTSSAAYTLLGLTAIVAALVGILVFAVLKFFAAAREARSHGVSAADRSSDVAGALASAVAHAHAGQDLTAQARAAAAFRLRVGERARALRAGLDAAGLSPDARSVLSDLAASLEDLVRCHEPPAGPVDLKIVIDGAVSGYRITTRARGGDVAVQGQFATVNGQADAIDFVLGALLSAALDACQRAGLAPVVAIRGERDDAFRRVRLWVEDNGPRDMPLPDLDTITSVARRLGGQVAVDDSPMGGRRICLDLPIALRA